MWTIVCTLEGCSSWPALSSRGFHVLPTLKTAESKRRELVVRSLKSHGVEEYTEQALDLLCALLSHEVQEHMTARRTLPTNALTIPSGGIVDAMTASSLALDITLPRSENRYNDAFSSVKRRRGVSGDVFEAVTRDADGMSTCAETVTYLSQQIVQWTAAELAKMLA
ncbi:hypothetical protein FOZ61_009087, partial [Perkinsus olseni]